ncbi:hypothetical protein DMC30DRAFT_131379 [Rhodotorula diobovata]|uniref:Uncharacterized protein n=1 Tax=Rhodotorula diobovata TaxID=5288 RepID=A0A5C5FKK2_9BASI|nr:hypothetical protein DMC30DRAFT_131379 [Rhodotorula diobovata]
MPRTCSRSRSSHATWAATNLCARSPTSPTIRPRRWLLCAEQPMRRCSLSRTGPPRTGPRTASACAGALAQAHRWDCARGASTLASTQTQCSLCETRWRTRRCRLCATSAGHSPPTRHSLRRGLSSPVVPLPPSGTRKRAFSVSRLSQAGVVQT